MSAFAMQDGGRHPAGPGSFIDESPALLSGFDYRYLIEQNGEKSNEITLYGFNP